MTTWSRFAVAAPMMLPGVTTYRPAAGCTVSLAGIAWSSASSSASRLSSLGFHSWSRISLGLGMLDLLARLGRCGGSAIVDALLDRSERELFDPVRLVKELFLDVRKDRVRPDPLEPLAVQSRPHEVARPNLQVPVREHPVCCVDQVGDVDHRRRVSLQQRRRSPSTGQRSGKKSTKWKRRRSAASRIAIERSAVFIVARMRKFSGSSKG